MSNLAYIGSSAMTLPPKADQRALPRPTGGWRVDCQDECLLKLSCLVAISGIFLLIGLAGITLFRGYDPITLSGRAGLGAVDNESTDVSMAELLADVETLQENPTEVEVEEVIEVPETVEVPVEIEDVPELTEALVPEDVFTIPAAPKIEVAMKPVDPTQPKPKPKPKPAVAKPRSSRAASTVTTTGGTEGSGGGGGGSGRAGSGSGKGKVPNPPYPSGARSRKVTGTLTFSLRVSPAGKVEYAAVVSSNCINGGFTASEQDQIASYICRNWFLPGRMGTLRLPVRFQLR